MRSERLKDKVAIVTGAGQGIGEAVARAFCEAGARVVIAERNPETGLAVAAALSSEGLEAAFVEIDVASAQGAMAMVAFCQQTFGSPDVLVNNAGIAVFDDPLALSEEDWRRCFAVDLDGAWRCARAALPSMLARGGGSVINIASVHSFQIIRGCFPYPVAKHALVGLTRALGLEYAARGLRVNAIAPGYIYTPVNDAYWATFPDPEAEKRRAFNIHPPGRIGRPEEVAMTALFLASDEAPFINAACIMIDGGRSALYHD
jgi:NAD(P)-dependent dehydrogenase (short-subunit alcohol dehydrogenase family)